MKRLLALLTVLLLAGVAVADIPPPPPPKGKKYIAVNNEVVLAKDVSGYVFVKQVNTFPGGRKPTYTKLELKTDKATAIPEPARRTFVNLYAVPQDAAKEFKTDEELFDALGANKVKGAHHIGFNNTATVSDQIKGDSVKWTYTITGIDEKGIKTKVEGEGYEPPTPPAKKERPPLAQSGTLVAGVAAFAAILLGGLWLASRARRKV